MIKVYNFTHDSIAIESYSKDKGFTILDKRNGFESVGTIIDTPKVYINYLKLLNSYRDKWINTHYFDIGLLPASYAPEAIHSLVDISVIKVLNKYNIRPIGLPSVALLKGGKNSSIQDYWVSRSEIVEKTGYRGHELTFSIIDFLEKEMGDVW